MSRRRRLAELVYRLRTEGHSPRQQASAVALGVFLGSLPIWGVHLPVCVALARLLRLSRITTYAAAHINNPLTLPFLLYAQVQVGSWLRRGEIYRLSLEVLREESIWSFGLDLLIGSVTVAAVLAAVAGAVAFAALAMRREDPLRHEIVENAARPYIRCGVRHWEFARAKLRADPVYLSVLGLDLLPDEGRLVDLGCGRGLLLALLVSSGHAGGLELVGIERRRRHAAIARRALGPRARILRGNLMRMDLPEADVAVLFDVLHYLPAPDQPKLLRRVASCLRPGGIILLREADASGGWAFRVTAWSERLMSVLRGHPRQPLVFRSAGEWRSLLAEQGLAVTVRPMDEGTPFANVLLVARRDRPR